MEAQSLETFQIGDKVYVMLYHAAKWLQMPLGDLEGQIALGKLELVRVEDRDFIELEALKAYAGKRKAWR
ncbi:MAG: hypothetical protein H0X30_00955 [Anaerolineae bacterium]|nr:hypothetical protein [Anaerolineae bacterium]